MEMLSERQKLILGLVIQEYVESAQPVGSKSLVRRYSLDISSATVRNEMAALAELGLLRQPHTSAGRVPTEEGYRYFVGQLMRRPDLPADWIMAHPTTVTGSIGVIFMRPGVDGFMEKYGFAMNVSKSGAQKDMGSPFRAPTEKDDAIFQELTDQMAARFYSLVQKHRKPTPQQMELIKTARIFMADEARKIGLVDEIGYLKDAVAKAKSLAGLKADAKVITYRRFESEDDNIYNPAMSSDLQGVPDGNLPTLTRFLAIPQAGFYYMWPAAVGGY